MSFDHKNIVITGAASGIGKALVLGLVSYDCQVLAIDKDEQGLNQLLVEISSSKMQVQYLVMDLTNQSQIQNLVSLSLEKLGQIDLFFANAGIAFYGNFTRQDYAARQALIMVNLIAPIEGLYQLLHANLGKEFSYIITASAMSKIGMPNYAMYAATKAALDNFANCFRFENNPGCHLMLAYPIATKTDFFNARENNPILWPSQSPKTVADAILKAVLKKRRSVYPSFLFKCMISLQLFNQWIMFPYQYWNRNTRN